ncbi:hypothetical protein BDV28DRAFT_130096 [Aspergillus coremiiformis]|uniref:Uncharacterized protein n=1 Tax=Aspergillus coremiiformis TaxID=138285 RepID=A0A5N6ZFI7_9EURO|nr:hypothetical protein BDV28DRAFT_130096 [Aspergillus coremiiformis]
MPQSRSNPPPLPLSLLPIGSLLPRKSGIHTRVLCGPTGLILSGFKVVWLVQRMIRLSRYAIFTQICSMELEDLVGK